MSQLFIIKLHKWDSVCQLLRISSLEIFCIKYFGISGFFSQMVSSDTFEHTCSTKCEKKAVTHLAVWPGKYLMYLLSVSDKYRMVSTKHNHIGLTRTIMLLIVQMLLVLITIQFVGAVDNCFTVSMRITNEIYSILLAEKGTCRPEKRNIYKPLFSLQNLCIFKDVWEKYLHQFIDELHWSHCANCYHRPLTFLPGGHTTQCSRRHCLLLHFRHSD